MTLAAEARVIGLDVILGTSADPILPGYDRDLLLALRSGAQTGRIVLGFAQHETKPVLPHSTQIWAVNGSANIRPTNVITDSDNIVRRVSLRFDTVDSAGTKSTIPQFAVEIAKRAGVVDDPDGDSDILLNFDPAYSRPRVYSLADLVACAEAGNDGFFRKAFADKIVLVGAVLDIEDRKLASNRFATFPTGTNLAPRCVHSVMPELSGQARATIPGVYILATAIENLLQGDWLRQPPRWQEAVMLFLISCVAAFISWRFHFLWSAAGNTALCLIWSSLALVVFRQHMVLPLLGGLSAVVIATLAGSVYRTVGSDRARRRLRKAFQLYLPASEVDHLVEQERLPELGGELREVTVLFSDIASYTSLSESLDPKSLVRDLNSYLTCMTEIVQIHGGFVDKYNGDGILAIFGAPRELPAHSLSAVTAALAMVRKLDQSALLIGQGRIAVRIGVHRGRVIVGNIGHPSRFNYTVIGDAVNVASRLEALGKRYDRPILISELVKLALGENLICRELDRVRVIGRGEPVTIYEPLAPEQAAIVDLSTFAMALDAWREGKFEVAGKAFAALARAGDTLAARYADWCIRYQTHPPAEWSGILQQMEK